MKKYFLMIVTLMLLFLFIISNSTLAAEPEFRIKFGSVVNETDINYMAIRDVFKPYVETNSKGRIVIDLYPNAQLGGERQIIEGMMLGTIQMGGMAPAVVASFEPTWQVFDLPYLFKNRDVAFKALDGELGDKLKSALLKKGLRCFVFPENGIRQITNNNKAIHKPDDLKGLKIRVMENPVHIAIFKALGANPTPISFGELYTALHQKTVDGQENPIMGIYASKFYEVQKYISLTEHLYAPTSLLINESFYQKLPKDLQEVLKKGADIYKTKERQMCIDMENGLLEKMVQSGMKANKLTPEEKQLFIDKTKVVYDQFRDKIGAELVDLAMSYNN